MDRDQLQFYSLYVSRFAGGFGRSLFVAAGGAGYGVAAMLVPLTPAVGDALGLAASAPVLGGWLMAEYGIEWAFYVGGAFALAAVAAFVGVLVRDHGAEALTEW